MARLLITCGVLALLAWIGHAAFASASSILEHDYLGLGLKALAATAVLDAIERGARTAGLMFPAALLWVLGVHRFRPHSRFLSIRPVSLVGLGLLCALALLAGYTLAARATPGPASGPNVLLITLDTLRRDHLSLYGHSRETSPELDRFAEQALVFDQAFAVGSWTTPNHASMFTGLHVIDHGASEEYKFLVPSSVTLAEILTNHGYASAAFVNNTNLGTRRGVTQGFQLLIDNWLRRDRGTATQPGAPEGDDGARQTVVDVLEWIEHGRDEERPFFLFVNFIEAHWPYDPPQAERELFLGDVAPPDYVVSPNLWGYIAGAYSLTPAEIAMAEALYDAEIRYMDAQLGKLLQGLQHIDALDETLVIITSDHGEEFGARGIIGHNLAIYDDVLAIPLVVRAPSDYTSAPTGRSAQPVSLLDVHATILDVTGAEAPPGVEWDGTSLLGPLEPRRLVAEYYRPVHHLKKLEKLHPDYDASRFDRRLRVVRDGDYKLIWGSDGSRELYRLPEDPGERKDLAAAEPERVAGLSDELEAWATGRGAIEPWDRPALPEVDTDTRKALEALGYAE